VVSVDLEEFQDQMSGPGTTRGSQRTTGRDQRESKAEPEGEPGRSRGMKPGRHRSKRGGGSVHNLGESSVAMQSSHPRADGPVGRQARVNQRWVPSDVSGREKGVQAELKRVTR